MRTLYVDMDGVLSDFETEYKKFTGVVISELRQNKDNFASQFSKFIDDKGFERLDKIKGADELLKFLGTLKKVRIAILTSSGGFGKHSAVQIQKMNWCCKQGIVYPVIVVPGRKIKAGYVVRESCLIDDTEDVIEKFNIEGGHGVLHHHLDVDKTIQAVAEWCR